MAIIKKKTPIAIIGGGLAGLTVAARLEKAGLDYLLIDDREFGGLLKGQNMQGAELDYGLKSVPLTGALAAQPLVQLKEELGLSIQIESFTETPRFFEGKTFSDFVGFGESKNRILVEELSYYAHTPRLLVSGGWKNLIESLLQLIPEKKRLPNSYVTKFEVNEDHVTHAVINGEMHLQADKFIFTLPPSYLKEFLPIGAVSGKILQRIARTEPLTAISIDLATHEPQSDAKNLFILREYSKTTEEELFVLGQFVTNCDPSRPNGGFHLSTWMTLVESESLLDDENGSKSIKAMKKVITKAFPKLIESVKWERLLVIPDALGFFGQLTLEKNSTLPGLENFWICGGKVQSAHRNLTSALDSARAVAESVIATPATVETAVENAAEVLATSPSP